MRKAQKKFMTRGELAECAGVSTATLARWIKYKEKQLKKIGYQRGRLLSPCVVAYLCKVFWIDV